MKKIIVSIMMAALCLSAVGQEVKDSLWEGDEDFSLELGDSKWEVGLQASALYNYSLNTPAGMSTSGFGLELVPIELRWNGWKSGFFTIGLVDMFFDWQYLATDMRFDSTVSPIAIVPTRGKGSRFNFGVGVPVGISQNFGKFGVSLTAIPGIGFYSYNNTYDENNYHIEETFYPRSNRYNFQLDVKMGLWYGNFGLLFRYSPMKSVDFNTTILSVGLSIRS